MNKIFKTLWNCTTQTFIVAYEFAKGCVKNTLPITKTRSVSKPSHLFKFSLLSLFLCSSMAMAARGPVTAPNGKIHADNNGISISG